MNHFIQKFVILSGILLLGLCAACKTSAPAPVAAPAAAPVTVAAAPEVPAGEPQFNLVFDRIEAKNIRQVSLFYTLQVENPRSSVLPLEIRNWQVELNGALPAASSLEVTSSSAVSGRPAQGARFQAPSRAGGINGDGNFGFRLDLDLPANSNNFDEYSADLTLSLSWQYGAELPAELSPEEPSKMDLSAAVVFPRIREPEFTITSITITQAELINTRFRVNLRIDNPNIFPVDLSSFDYELYGTGRFWADGKEKDVLMIPARGSAETRLFLVMNFINMKRELLNEVIALGRVPYRFSGAAMVATGIPLLPEFHIDFSRSGVSTVIK
jgi:LEA14-like dessication related protein